MTTLSKSNTYLWLMGMQNGRTIWGDRLAVSYKVKHSPTM